MTEDQLIERLVQEAATRGRAEQLADERQHHVEGVRSILSEVRTAAAASEKLRKVADETAMKFRVESNAAEARRQETTGVLEAVIFAFDRWSGCTKKKEIPHRLSELKQEIERALKHVSPEIPF